MKKHLLIAMFIFFLPHYVIWGTILLSGFSIDYKEVFNSTGFWAIVGMWWFMAGLAVVVSVINPPSGINQKFSQHCEE